MKSILALIIFSDGAAAFIGALAASRIGASTKRPALAKILMVGLLGYAVARFWQAWNIAEHGQELVECVAKQSPAYLRHYYGSVSLQALTAWSATIYLILTLLNGSFSERLSRIGERIKDIFQTGKSR